MLNDFVGPQTNMDDAAIKAEKNRFQDEIVSLLQPLKESKIPIVVLIEGWDSSGKATLISELASKIDPRFFSVFTEKSDVIGTERYPFIYPYFKAIPEGGKILFMDSGWLQRIVDDDLHGKTDAKEKAARINSINIFERQLKNDGYIVLKFFINISEKKQRKAQEFLLSDKNTKFRVTDDDKYQNKHYDKFQKAYEEVMDATTVHPWHILDGDHKKLEVYEAFRIFYNTINDAIKAGKYNGEPYEEEFPMYSPAPRLENADLSAKLAKEDYEVELKRLQKSIHKLHGAIYRKKIPMVICYEGWDAGGKGGNIRRLAKPLDPRGFDTYPIASPLPPEKSRHHLWRFWTKVPKSGHIAIFDRTWYGRVMVERLEGFCTENDWKRAYNEINEFEKELHDAGTIIVKFWIQIDKETQLERFTDRQNTPSKQWKITDEDWRNREKWDLYEGAISEMIEKTSTEYAPWFIIESVDKYYARIKALKIVEAAMKYAIGETK